MKDLIVLFLLALLLVGVVQTTSIAAPPPPDISFSWLPNAPEEDISGYKLYGDKTLVKDLGLITSNTDGRIYYTLPIELYPTKKIAYSLTAYNSSGLESDFSQEVVYNPVVPLPVKGLEISIKINFEVTP